MGFLGSNDWEKLRVKVDPKVIDLKRSGVSRIGFLSRSFPLLKTSKVSTPRREEAIRKIIEIPLKYVCVCVCVCVQLAGQTGLSSRASDGGWPPGPRGKQEETAPHFPRSREWGCSKS